jgi:hypothetical protein
MKDPESGRRRSRARQDADIVIKQVPELRIVTDDLWEVARQRQRRLDACAAGTAPAGADKHLESAAIDPKLSNRFQLRLLRNLGASSACTQAANQ